ncbi:LysM peptidoglycan-binding domain-containing protein [Polaromonas sp. C04]|uniref:LysM peptidoglycan-binding domain-containing protein n=1 Tax=Polaromonas sp. C04 TaxID=1945857 RepID=UPI000986CDD2|nr:LysM peptidoglycan-binding domain-containing protein [Polaromonas sp. C04]OOG58056.1 hypothetical protein B0E49_04295 [Polaromonas sp. C04]
MKTKVKRGSTGKRGNPPPVLRDEQPLLRALVAEAARRGDTLAGLAKALGVSYERLAQWRRNVSAIRNAHGFVHENAARYLGVPTVLVLVLAGVVCLEQFVWPQKGPVSERVTRDLERLRQHPFIGPFVPPELAAATPPVQLFVAFLFHELGGDTSRGEPTYRWLTALHQAALGNVEAQGELDALRSGAAQGQKLF